MEQELSLEDFAELTKSPLAQGYLLHLTTPNSETTKLLASALAKNENLSLEIWEKLFDQSSYPNTTTLLHNAPTRSHTLKLHSLTFSVARIEAIKLGLPHLTKQDILDLIAAPFFDAHHAAALLQSGQAPAALLLKLWDEVLTIDRSAPLTHGQSTMSSELHPIVLEAVAGKYQVMDDATLLRNIIAEALPYKNIARLIDLRPPIIPLLISNLCTALPGRFDVDILTAIAVSQHLTPTFAATLQELLQSVTSPGHKHHRAARALAENPANSTALRLQSLIWLALALDEGSTIRKEIYETQIGELQAQALSQLQPLPAPWGEIPETQLLAVLNFTRLTGLECYPTLVGTSLFTAQGMDRDRQATRAKATLIDSISPKLDTAGVSAWDIFLSMLPTWNASIDELLEATLSNASI